MNSLRIQKHNFIIFNVFIVFLLVSTYSYSNGGNSNGGSSSQSPTTHSSQGLPQLCATDSRPCQRCYRSFESDSGQDFNNSGSCPCPDGMYNDKDKQLCLFCPIQCTKCTSHTQCFQCLQGFKVQYGQCIQTNYNVDDWQQIIISLDFDDEKITNKNRQQYKIINAVSASSIENYFNNCPNSGQLYFGGFYFDYKTQIYNSYFSLPYHQWAQFKFYYIIIDQWINQSIQLSINQYNSYQRQMIDNNSLIFSKTYNTTKFTKDICGSNDYADGLGFIFAELPHNLSVFTMRISTSQRLSNKSTHNNYFAVREIGFRIGTCSRNCLKCSSGINCIQCKQNYFRNDNGKCQCNTNTSIQTQFGCIKKCSQGQIYLQQIHSCIVCQFYISRCEECSSVKNCLKCQQGFYLFEGICINECPKGLKQKTVTKKEWYNLTTNSTQSITVCVPCPQGCQVCSYNICQVCSSNYYYHKGTCKFLCPSTTYASFGVCLPCQQNCQQCESKNYCTNCKQLSTSTGINFINYYGKCQPICTNFIDTSRPCVLGCGNLICHSSCIDCFGTTSQSCLSCYSPYLLQNFKCIDNCSKGYYNNYGKCERCSYTCQECNQYRCLKCHLGYLLQQQQCKRSCSKNYYLSSNITCQKCEQNCLRCLDSNSCLECPWNWHLINGTCQKYIICPNHYYLDNRVGNCISCQNNCLKCFRDLCYFCDNQTYLDNGKCLESCSSEKIQYFKEIKHHNGTNYDYGFCKWKDPLCNQYDQNYKSNCKQCIFSDPKLVLIRNGNSNYCDFICPKGFTKNLTNQLECLSCPNNCLKCLENGICLQCQGLVLQQNNTFTCLLNCPQGYYKNHMICTRCSFACLKCIDNLCYECNSSTQLRNNSCYSTCQIGKYKYTNNQCINCHSNCLTCYGSSTFCTSCKQSFYLNQTICLSSCQLPSFYADNITGKCISCSIGCKQCSYIDNCTKCQIGYQLFQDGIYQTCILNCPIGYYSQINNSYYCQKCSNNCHTCFGSLPQQCLTCHQNFILDHTKCVHQCPINRYEDINGHCDWCHESCQRCFGPASFQCLKCNGNYTLYMNKCWSICPGATYLVNPNQGICQECQWGCSICNSTTNCFLCFGGFYLYQGLCYSKCPYGTTWKLASNAGLICVPCQLKYGYWCQQCSGYIGCLKCKNSSYYYLYASYNKTFQIYQNCLTNCPIGTYASKDNSIWQCLPCKFNCKQCTSSSNCTHCYSQYIQKNNNCNKKCSNNYYYTFQNNNNNSIARCLSCIPNCKKCTNNYTCIKCSKNYYKLQINNTIECIKQCPFKYYQSYYSNNQCYKCIDNCLQCSNYANCLRCQNGYLLDSGICLSNETIVCQIQNCSQCISSSICKYCSLPYLLQNNTNCVNICSIGYYANGRECMKCHPNCLECTSSLQCSTCIPGLFKMNDICDYTCPDAYFANNFTSQCTKCSQNCQQCTNSYNCTKCSNSMLLVNGQCQKQCSKGTYYSISDQICTQCSLGCINCLQKQYCTSCQVNLFLYKNKCINQCPNSYYKNGKICSSCLSPCLTCTNSTSCTTCQSSYILNGTQCQKSCSIGYFIRISNSTQKTCQICSSNCLSCTNQADLCNLCIDGLILFNKKCLKICPMGSYLINNSCRKCPMYCLKCSNYSSCTTCHSSMVLHNNKCINTCPNGYYTGYQSQISTDNNTNICLHCISPCKQCTYGSIYHCISCQYGFLHEKRCKLICPLGTYADLQFKICKQCSSNCQNCTNNNCTQCKNNSYSLTPTGFCIDNNNNNTMKPICSSNGCIHCPIDINSCIRCNQNYFLFNQTCLSNCPSNYINSIYGTCQSCPQRCQNCDNLFKCTKCKDNYFLFRSQCLNQCPSLTIAKNKQCQFDPCLQWLNVSGNLKCLQCISPYRLQQSNCVKNCPIGTYRTDFACQNCSQGCLNCISDDKCLQCSNSTLLSYGQCVLSCINGQVSNRNGTCIACPDPNCQVCMLKSDKTICTGCKISLNYILFNDNCVTTCPIKYYKDLSYYQCKKCPNNCTTCINAYNCTNCQSQMQLINGLCQSNCSVLNPNCQKCSSNCKLCSSSNKCIQCENNYYLWQNVCWFQCPKSTYIFNNTHCKNCQLPCITCISSTKCTSCSYGKLEQFQCKQNCSNGSYQIQIKQEIIQNDLTPTQRYSKQCKQCSPICKKCQQSSISCQQCYPGYLLDSYGNCMQNCTNSQVYFNTLTYQCLPCSQDCQACYGPQRDQCIVCQQPLLLYSSGCVKVCPNGLYENKLRQCIACDFRKCLFCSYSESNCTLCHGGFYLHKGQCLSACPTSYRKDDSTRSCVGCDSNCMTCSLDSNNLKCTKCSLPMYLHQEQCVQSCPTGYTGQNLINSQQCIICPSYCQQCSNKLSCSRCSSSYIIHNGVCLSQCSQGTYKRISSSSPPIQQCISCNLLGCKTCEISTTITKCTICLSSYLLIENDFTCIKNNCPSGYKQILQTCIKQNQLCQMYQYGSDCLTQCPFMTYISISNSSKICQQCNQGCQQCISYTQCTLCSSTYIQYQNKTNNSTLCLKNCPLGYYKRDILCLQCDNSCTNCIFLNNQQICLTCSTNFSLIDGQCLQGCSSITYKQYINQTLTCKPCSIKCKTCQSGLQCTTCKNIFYQLPFCNQSNCSTNQYINNNLQCKQCHSSCSQCYGPSFYQCTDCDGTQKILINGICTTKCPTQFYTTNPNICLPCLKTNCLSCYNILDCNQCKSPYILAFNTCISQCKQLNNLTHTFYSTSSSSCSVCNITNCAQCEFQNNKTSCITCKNYLYNQSCIADCPPLGTTPVLKDTKLTCKNCPQNCSACSYNTQLQLQCTNCSDGFYLFQNQCLSSCPQNTYISDLKCKLCRSANCQQCNYFQCTHCTAPFQPSSGGCFSCMMGYYYQDLSCKLCGQNCANCSTNSSCIQCSSGYYLFNNSCVSNCPISYSINPVNSKQCSSCSTNCTICINNTTCQQCKQSYLNQFVCISQCPNNTYTFNNICYNCPLKCLICDSADKCTSCQNQSVLFQGQCNSACIMGYTSVNGICQPCLSGCKNCSTGLSTCTSCRANLIVHSNGSCVLPDTNNTCSDSQYLTFFKQCSNCHPSCLSCSNGQITGCLTCNEPQYKLQIDGSCQLMCQNGNFYSNLSNKCQNCTKIDISCLSCKSTTCLECQSPKIVGIDGTCTLNCPNATYLYNQQCKNCSNLCLQCTSKLSCITCQSGSVKYNNLCYSQCPSGTYDNSNGQCAQCSIQCKLCQNSATNCSSCLYPYNLNSANHSCVQICPKGTQAKQSICQSCSIDWINCTACNSTQCTECSSNLLNGSCISSCPQNYLQTNSKCIKCQNPCQKCSKLLSNCTSCINGFVLNNNKCNSQCSNGKYKSNKTCIDCQTNNCKSCSQIQCFKCQSNYYLNQLKKCVRNCDSNYFKNDVEQTCDVCKTNCTKCTNSQNCLNCQINLYLLNEKQCLQECPFSYFNNSNQQCQSCPTSCKKCQSSTYCIQCQSLYYLILQNSGNECTNKCPQKHSTPSNMNGYGICLPCIEFCQSCNQNQCQSCETNYFLKANQCIHKNCKNCTVCTGNKCQQCDPQFYILAGLCYNECPIAYFAQNITTNITINITTNITNNEYGICSICIDNCIVCPDQKLCTQCIPDYDFTEQTGCIDQAILTYGFLANMSTFTSNITQTIAKVYLSTSAGPMVFGEMSTTYFNIEFCQFVFFHDAATGGNPQMQQFLDSLQVMSLTSGNSDDTTGRRRMLSVANYQNSFLQTNIPIFALMACFISLYIAVFIFQKYMDQCCSDSPKVFFYLYEICNFMQKRFKWIYFDFIMWISFLPFTFFSLLQLKNFNFQTFTQGFSSLLSMVIIVAYPLYPIFICYLIKSQYYNLCIQGKDSMVQMSLSPYMNKVRRPQQLPQQNEPFKYLNIDNFRMIYVPLEYLRKLIFILVIAASSQPITTVSILIGLNIIFICYIISFKPRVMPYLIFDLIVEFVLLAFEIFMLVYLSLSGAKIALMSIITHAVGFLTANLSLVVAIIMNLIAYYKIFMCIYDLIRHLKQKADQKQKEELKDDPQNNIYEEQEIFDQKSLGGGKKKKKIQDDDITQQFFDQGDKQAIDLIDDKELIFNGVKRPSKKCIEKQKLQQEQIPNFKVSNNRRKNNKNPVQHYQPKIQQSEEVLVGDKQIEISEKSKYKRDIGQDLFFVHKSIIHPKTNKFQKNIDPYKQENNLDQDSMQNLKQPYKHQDGQHHNSDSDDMFVIKSNKKPREGEFIDRNKKKKQEEEEDIFDGQMKDRPKNRDKNGDLEQGIPSGNLKDKHKNRDKNGEQDIPSGNFKDRSKNREKNGRQDQDIPSGNFKDRPKNKDKNGRQEQDIPSGNFKDRSKNREKNTDLEELKDKDVKHKKLSKEDPTKIGEADTYDLQKKQKKYPNQSNKDLQQGNMKDRMGNAKKIKPIEQFDQFLEQNKSTELFVNKDKKNAKKHPILQKNISSDENNENSLQDGNMRDKQRNIIQKKKYDQKQTQDDFMQIGQIQTVDKSPNKFQRKIGNEDTKGKDWLEEARMKDIEQKKKKKENGGNQKLKEDYLKEGQMNQHKGKKKEKREERLNEDAELGQIGTYDHRGNRRNKDGRNQGKIDQMQQGVFKDHRNRAKQRKLQSNKQDQFETQQGKTYERKNKKANKYQEQQDQDNLEKVKEGQKQTKKKRTGWNDNSYEQEQEKQKKQEKIKRNKDKLMQVKQHQDQDYDDIVKRNKQNMIEPTKKDRKMMVIEDDEFQESQFERPPSKIQKPGGKHFNDQGLNVKSNGSDFDDNEGSPDSRRKKPITNRLNRKANLKIDNGADKFQQDNIKGDERKQSKILKTKNKKAGVLKIEDMSEDENFDSIQL